MKWFDGSKGFGFIACDDFDRDLFLHIRQLQASGHTTVAPGEPVSFEVMENAKGIQAVGIRRIILDDEQVKKVIGLLQEHANRKFRLLLVGRTGVAKSATINTLLGAEVAAEKDYVVGTTSVSSYVGEINGVPCAVFDTPGLCDDDRSVGNDERYIEMIRSEVEEFDCLLYFTPLIDTRVRRDEKEAIEVLTKAFGTGVWSRAVIVLTMADRAADRTEYRDYLQNRAQLLRQEVVTATGSGRHNSIPVVATTNRQPTTPDGQTWLDELFASMLARLKEHARIPFFCALAARVDVGGPQGGRGKSDRNLIVLKESTSHTVEQVIESGVGPIVGGAAALAAVGAQIGVLGGPALAVVGGFVGASVGATLGAIGRLFRKGRRRQSDAYRSTGPSALP